MKKNILLLSRFMAVSVGTKVRLLRHVSAILGGIFLNVQYIMSTTSLHHPLVWQ